jgi:regulatory protein
MARVRVRGSCSKGQHEHVHEHGFRRFSATPRRAQASLPPSDDCDEAFERALKYLAYRARSETEVLKDLARHGFSPETTRRTLEKLRSLNYINDERFAWDWARARMEAQGHGPRRIAHESNAKGVPEPLIRGVLRRLFESESESANARRWLEKKFKNEGFRDPKTARRAAGFLQRKGYSGKVIFQLLKCRLEDE